MKSDKNEMEESIKEIEEYNKKFNNPSYWISGKQTLPIKGLSKSKLGLTVTGILGLLFSIGVIFGISAKSRLNYQSIFYLLVVLIISTAFLIKAFRMKK